MRTLHVAVASASANSRRAVAAVLRWDGEEESKAIVRSLEPDDTAPPSYRALVLGLWEARRAGAKLLDVAVDAPEVAAHLEGTEDPAVEVIGPYLQARALLNAFDHVRIRYVLSPLVQRAAKVAVVAVQPKLRYADLPLWVASRTRAA